MTLSFIVTTYDILDYVERCLASVAACARAGDTVIVVDDGSADGTAEKVEATLEATNFQDGVRTEVMLFGANTAGGVGIAGNTGLHLALSDPACDAVFFVDGDDWLEPAGFQASRRAFAMSQADILIANYAEYDEQAGTHRRPADAAAWARIPRLPRNDPAAARRLALSMIAVPWRKFYRAGFLRQHGLRFPEGDFFFEDNPFHWAVCLKADRIAFHDRILCQHRINRPGQTMESTGTELIAFFDHYDTILSLLPTGEDTLAQMALEWLLNNMTWHVSRLHPEAFWPYAMRAAKLFAAVPDRIWQPVYAAASTRMIGGVAEALRRGDTAGVVAVWMQSAQATTLEALEERLDALEAAIHGPLEQVAAQVSGLNDTARYQALLALPGPAAETK